MIIALFCLLYVIGLLATGACTMFIVGLSGTGAKTSVPLLCWWLLVWPLFVTLVVLIVAYKVFRS